MSKMWAWVQALLGRPIEEGEEIDLDDLIGRECMLDITHQKTERGVFERIVGVRPVKQRRGSSKTEEEQPSRMEEETQRQTEEDFDGLPL